MPDFTLEEINGIAILKAAGRLVGEMGDSPVEDAVRNLLSKGQTRIIFDLSAVVYMDSCILGDLLEAGKLMSVSGSGLKLVNSPRVRDILVICRLHGAFDVFDDLPAAIASFAA